MPLQTQKHLCVMDRLLIRRSESVCVCVCVCVRDLHKCIHMYVGYVCVCVCVWPSIEHSAKHSALSVRNVLFYYIFYFII